MSGFLVAMLEPGRGARTAADSVRPPFKQMTALTAGKYYRLKRLVAGVSGYMCDECVSGSKATRRIPADGPKPLI
jgi:hypothetical protein